MKQLIRYDAMCRAIDAAYRVDEVKDIRDKALAIEIYARQAKNKEAERAQSRPAPRPDGKGQGCQGQSRRPWRAHCAVDG